MNDSNYYRGYVPLGADKQSLLPFKGVPDSSLLTLDEAQRRGAYAGVLREGVVLVDTDTPESSAALLDIIETLDLQCRVYRTDKGVHALFRDPEGEIEKAVTGHVLACGIVADFKLGSKNGYEVLDRGQGAGPREIIRDPAVVAEIPPFLYPVAAESDGTRSMVAMGAGDGRNDHLFSWILRLQGIGLSKDQIRHTLSVANKHVFAEPMPESEIDTIARDESFKKASFYKKNRFMHHTFGKFLISEHHIKRLDGKLHVYDATRGIYRSGDDQLEHLMVQHIEDLPSHQRQEVLKYLHAQLQSIALSKLDNSVNYIAFRNGLFNLTTGNMEPFRPDVLLLNSIPWDYEPDIVCEDTDKMLDKIAAGDPGVRYLIEEMMGYTMYRANIYRKAFVLLGDGSNGKSTLIHLMERVLGEENTSHLDMQQLANRFDLEMLHGKLANLGDDISDEFMKGQQVSIFKKIVTGNKVKAEEKGKPAFSFAPYSKLIFAANAMPRIKDDSHAIQDRLLIVPFNARFTKSDPDYDPHIVARLRSDKAVKRMIVLAVDALLDVLERDAFTQPDAVTREVEKFAIENDSVLGFLDETPRDQVYGSVVKDILHQYEQWCHDNGMTPKGQIKLSKGVKLHYRLKSENKSIGGRSARVYVDMEEGDK